MTQTETRGVDSVGYLTIGVFVATVGGLVVAVADQPLGWFAVAAGVIPTSVGVVALGVRLGTEEVARRTRA